MAKSDGRCTYCNKKSKLDPCYPCLAKESDNLFNKHTDLDLKVRFLEAEIKNYQENINKRIQKDSEVRQLAACINIMLSQLLQKVQ